MYHIRFLLIAGLAVAITRTPVISGVTSNNDENVVFSEPSSKLLADLANEDFDWVSVNTRHARIYFEKNSYAASHINYLEDLTEESVVRALSIIGKSSYDKGIILMVVDSKEKMNKLIGMTVKGLDALRTNMIYLVFNENIRPYLKHEIMHKVSISFLGEPPAWMREGSAMYADGVCLEYDNPLDVIPAYLMNKKMLIPIDDLVNRFKENAGKENLITYLESASLFKYIYENYGWEKITDLWKNEPDKLPEILGKSYKDLERDWRGHLSTIDISKVDINWDELLEKGCG